MQYIIIFLIVFLIMAAMTLFFFLLIKNMAADLSGQVKRSFLRQIEVFDRIYEEKSENLRRIQDQLEREKNNIVKRQDETGRKTVTQTSLPKGSAVDIPAARLISRDFSENYRYVKDHFHVDLDAAMERVQETEISPQEENRCRLLFQLRDQLSFDVIYRLSSLNADQQEQILREALSKEECLILDEYLQREGKMDAAGFADYVESCCFLNNTQPMVYTDGGICEGFQILQNGRVYDYSI